MKNPLGLSRRQLLGPANLITHRDGSISVRVYRRPKWRWLRHCSEIEQRDFRRLSEREKARIARLKIPVLPDCEY